MFSLSYKIPKWIGVYWSTKDDVGETVGATEKRLRFSVQWSIWRYFGKIYILSLLFFCGAAHIKIPLSAVCGIVIGFLLWYLVFLARTKWQEQKTKMAIFLAFLISVASAWAFASGCWYIHQVWGRNRQDDDRLSVGSFLAWLFLVGLIHLAIYKTTIRKYEEEAALPPEQRTSRKYQTRHFDPNHMSNLRKDIEQSCNMEESRQMAEAEKNIDSNCSEKESNSVHNKKDGGEGEEGEIGNGSVENSDVEVPRITNAASNSDGKKRLDSSDTIVEEQMNESWFSLVRLHCCGNDKRNEERHRKSRLEKVLSFSKWSAWFIANAFVLFLVIVNIGATHQYKVVQENLPLAFATLYPVNYNNGTVCAWDNNGPNSIIQTFDTPEDALAANFSVVHCGACGACSTWNDLRLQWTTRTYLADAAQNCAKQSLLGGRDSVQDCNEEQIGFSEACATCWTVDELCARDNCVFIFFQSVMTNRMNNFQVGPNEITSATCDEAMCGPEFVPCSGATRRRMDIVSTIARPLDQQCRILNQDWSTIFDHP